MSFMETKQLYHPVIVTMKNMNLYITPQKMSHLLADFGLCIIFENIVCFTAIFHGKNK